MSIEEFNVDFVGIPQVIIMTKVDRACELVKVDLGKMYQSKKIKEKVISLYVCRCLHLSVRTYCTSKSCRIDQIWDRPTWFKFHYHIFHSHIFTISFPVLTKSYLWQFSIIIYSNACRSLFSQMDVCSVNVGIPLNAIYPVMNYSESITQDSLIDMFILTALRDILNFANDYVERELEKDD